MTTLTPRLQIAAMLLQGLYASQRNISDQHHARNFALQEADALIAECGEHKLDDNDLAESFKQGHAAGSIDAYNRGYQAGLQATQPRKVEVTDEMVTVDAVNMQGSIRCLVPPGADMNAPIKPLITETAQPRKIEVTEVKSLLSNLIEAINEYNELERLYILRDNPAFKDAERYINGADQ